MAAKEYSIMPRDPAYSTERFSGSHRHEVFYGPYRQKSIRLGLVVFLTPEMHNASGAGVHFNRDFCDYLKRLGQRAAMNRYGWSTDDFIREFGKNYLEG